MVQCAPGSEVWGVEEEEGGVVWTLRPCRGERSQLVWLWASVGQDGRGEASQITLHAHAWRDGSDRLCAAQERLAEHPQCLQKTHS